MRVIAEPWPALSIAPEVELGWEIEDLATELEETPRSPRRPRPRALSTLRYATPVLGEARLLYSAEPPTSRALPHRCDEVAVQARFVLLGT